ncbi:MAG: M23 family metallopeptidase [Rikenellaceae bacterium]|jgi:murein DD-endopeptidase MepM/ murein hydrolase activator NlpD|nr:M23 family metallopeptidase [Rikenellaceae bacterium]
MQYKRNFTYFIRNLSRKHRLSLQGEHEEGEVWYMHISVLSALAGILAVVLLLFIVILTTVAYTPILDLIPGYPGNRSRELLVENIMRLDSLERQLASMQVYADNVALIMDGKTPVVRSVTGEVLDTLKAGQNVQAARNAADSALRAQVEGGGPYQLNTAQAGPAKGAVTFVAPVKGVIAGGFNPREGRYGASITTPPNQQVVAVREGTVTLSLWSPDEGFVVQVQHTGNTVSIYRHCASVLPAVGARVKADEVIAYTGEGGRGTFGFGLWIDGVPVDPQTYIVF